MTAASDELKQAVLAKVRAGVSYRTISEQHDVGLATISRWAAAAGIESDRASQTSEAVETTKLKWAQRRGRLTDRLGDIIETLLDKVEASDTPAKDVRDLTWSAAVLTDKAQLLSGGVTSRHEQLNAQRALERIGELGDELAQRRASKDGTTGG